MARRGAGDTQEWSPDGSEGVGPDRSRGQIGSWGWPGRNGEQMGTGVGQIGRAWAWSQTRVVTRWMAGVGSPIWYPIPICPIPLLGTPPPIWHPIPDRGTPSRTGWHEKTLMSHQSENLHSLIFIPASSIHIYPCDPT